MYILGAVLPDWFQWVFSGIGIIIVTSCPRPLIRWIKKKKEERLNKKSLQKQMEVFDRMIKIEDEKVRLRVMPVLSIGNFRINKRRHLLSFDLNNAGGEATFASVVVTSNNLNLKQPTAIVLAKGKAINLQFKYTGNDDMSTDEYSITFSFKDKLNNIYRVSAFGKGNLQIPDLPKLITL